MENTGNKRPDKASNQPGSQPEPREQPAAPEQTSEGKGPITNQDEQRQATNAGNDQEAPVNASQPAADRRHEERSQPYKNTGKDSEEIEEETTTME
jgi:hypothetical protein